MNKLSEKSKIYYDRKLVSRFQQCKIYFRSNSPRNLLETVKAEKNM